MLRLDGEEKPSICTCRPARASGLDSCIPVRFEFMGGSDDGGIDAIKQHWGPAWEFRVSNLSVAGLSPTDARNPDETLNGW